MAQWGTAVNWRRPCRPDGEHSSSGSEPFGLPPGRDAFSVDGRYATIEGCFEELHFGAEVIMRGSQIDPRCVRNRTQ